MMSETQERPYEDALYNWWLRVAELPHESAWEKFDAFYVWAMEAGFAPYRKLKKIDPKLPFGPQNCKFVEKKIPPKAVLRESAESWDQTVALFKERLAYAEANNPAAIQRLVDNMQALTRKTAPRTDLPGAEQGGRKCKHPTSTI